MSRHSDVVSLRHMVDHAREAVALMQGKDQAELERSRVLQLALVRLVEIIGEASNRVSKEIQAKHPEIAWAQISAMRNRLIHPPTQGRAPVKAGGNGRAVPREASSRWEATRQGGGIHGYDVIDSEIVWLTVTRDLPQLIVGLERILSARQER